LAVVNRSTASKYARSRDVEREREGGGLRVSRLKDDETGRDDAGGCGFVSGVTSDLGRTRAGKGKESGLYSSLPWPEPGKASYVHVC